MATSTRVARARAAKAANKEQALAKAEADANAQEKVTATGEITAAKAQAPAVSAKTAAATTRREKRVAAQQEAEREADVQDQALFAARAVEEPIMRPGEPLTLHQLNQIAKRNAYAIRDAARDAANAAGKAAFGVLSGSPTTPGTAEASMIRAKRARHRAERGVAAFAQKQE